MTIERTLQAAGDGPIILALSGGGDSVALLHTLAARAAPLRAVVVDHALREGSGRDAARAASFARALGVSADVVTLRWALGETRNQASARRKRYAALCEGARAHGARIVAVAHTADDQAETVFMRASKGSGWRGLAGMAALAPAPVWPEGRDVLLARPLLDARRADLRDLLRTRAAAWIEDPANSNPAFERVRVRARLAALEQGGIDPMRLVRFAAKMRVYVDEVDAQARALIARAARFAGPDIVLDLLAWNAAPEVRQRALSVLIAAAAGAEREPAPAALARLEARLRDNAFRGASLGGARLARRGDAVRLTRDPGAIEGRAGVIEREPESLPIGVDTIWDGRLALCAAQPARLIPAASTPLIGQGSSQIPLAEACAAGLVSARWLMELHVNHQLGPLSTTMGGL